MSSHRQHHPQSLPSDHRDAEGFRPHRWLGEQLDLFHFPAHSPGMASWHPKGMAVLDALHVYIRELNRRYGYQEVRSPLVCDHALWERSGHLGKFADKMFHVQVDGRPSALRPMRGRRRLGGAAARTQPAAPPARRGSVPDGGRGRAATPGAHHAGTATAGRIAGVT
jgi:seryl-tRNA synthetase